ncbi:MAG: phage/plasmid primase, P4 family [Candidatus Ozemobacteraceae bacterium]
MINQTTHKIKLSPARKACALLCVPFSSATQEELVAAIKIGVALNDDFSFTTAMDDIDVLSQETRYRLAASTVETAKNARASGMLSVPQCLSLSVVSEVCRICPHHGKITDALDLDPKLRGMTQPAPYQSPRERFNPNRTTNLGNAERLISFAGEDIRYSESRGWLVWNGKRWEPGDAAMNELFKSRVIPELYREAAAAATRQDAAGAKELATWAKRSENDGFVSGALTMARTDKAIYLPEAGSLDANAFLLGVANGVIDLRTGDIRPHDRHDMITRLAPVTYDPNAICPLWHIFLHKVMGGDTSLISFLQRSVGYSMTGDVSEQCFFVLHGAGANGKSVFCDVIMELLGDDLSTETPADSLMLRRNDNGATNDLARLAGLRLVTANETESGQRLAESRVKSLVGGDKIAARFLHREFFTFRPTFKIFLRTNHKPQITGTDLGIWRRVRLVPFTITIPPEEQDKGLVDKLRGELPGILNWAIAGAVSWYADRDLSAPQRVISATSEYRSTQDSIGTFLDERCYVSSRAEVPASVLYAEYKSWAEQRGDHPKNLTLFGESLTERGFGKRRGNTGAYIRSGVGLKTSEQSEHYSAKSLLVALTTNQLVMTPKFFYHDKAKIRNPRLCFLGRRPDEDSYGIER